MTVTKLDGAHTSEVVADARRVEFADSKFAYDLEGSAGKTALLINAAFGPAYLKPNYLGVVMDLFDQGMSVQAVADLAVPIMNDLAGTGDNAAFVTMLYQNVVNHAPDAVSLATYQGVLDRGEMTQAAMLTAVTTLEVNETAINLVGMSHAGLGFL